MNKLSYAVYLLAGSPDRPSYPLLWASVYLPSLLLGVVTGALAVLLSERRPLRGLAVFLVALVIGTVIFAVLFDNSVVDYLESFYVPVGNRFFFVGLVLWPTMAHVRRRAV